MIMVTSSFLKSSVFRMFPSTLKRKAYGPEKTFFYMAEIILVALISVRMYNLRSGAPIFFSRREGTRTFPPRK